MSQPTSTADGSLVRGILLAVLILIALPFVLMILMMPMMGAWGIGHMSGWMWNETGASWVFIGMWLVMLGILLGGGYLLYRTVRTQPNTSDPEVAELRAAYARGDLSDEEFEERRNRLQRT